VPDVESEHERSEEEQEVDAVIERVGIVEAYNRWAQKGHVDPKGRTEGIKVRCPNPAHPDHDPSAWLNTTKEVWVCGGCGMEGGDKFDIAAWGLGFPVPGYKDGKKFPELRRAMAASMGYTVRKRGKTETATKEPEAANEPEPADAPSPPSNKTNAPTEPEPEQDKRSNVVPLRPTSAATFSPDVTKADVKFFQIPWQRIVPEGTFMWDWMVATSQDDLPEEYHFWTGLTAVGLALGNDVGLSDYNPVHGNLFTTVIGRTASGKSRALSHLSRLVESAFPYEYDPVNTGVKHIRGAGSGEVLIDSFSEVHEDDGGAPFTVPVRGLIEFNELAALVGKARSGSSSILKPVLMDFYDHSPVVSAVSRTAGNMRAVDPFGSCITTTQPRAVRDLVSNADMDSGFLNRWVFVYGVEKTRVAYNLEPIDLSKPIQSAKGLKGWAAMRRGTSQMVLTGDALELWEKFFHEKIIPLYDPSDESEEDNPMYGRLALLFKKLILLFAANSREANPSVESVQRALSLWTYILYSYSKVSGSIANTPETELENSIIAMLQGYHEEGRAGASTKEIVDKHKSRFSREDIKQVLQRLETLMLIEEVTLPRKGSRGPTPKVYALAMHDD
jgi:hypothetical protein